MVFFFSPVFANASSRWRLTAGRLNGAGYKLGHIKTGMALPTSCFQIRLTLYFVLSCVLCVMRFLWLDELDSLFLYILYRPLLTDLVAVGVFRLETGRRLYHSHPDISFL